MPQGWVTTARGEALDLDGLINKANLPLVKEKQTKTQVTRRTVSKRKPLNIRGHQPAQGQHKMAEMPEQVAEIVEYRKDSEGREVYAGTTLPKSSYAETGEAHTAAEMTGMKVKPTEGAIERAKERASGGAPGPVEVANEALGEILGDLEESNPNAASAAAKDDEESSDKPARRTRKKTASE